MPGGTICSIATCKSNSKQAKKAGHQISFFTFPSDILTRREWIKKCQRKDKFHPVNKRICSLHFRPNDYEDALQSRLMNTVPKKLKKGAVPSVNVPSAAGSLASTVKSFSSKMKERRLKKKTSKLALELLEKNEEEDEYYFEEAEQQLLEKNEGEEDESYFEEAEKHEQSDENDQETEVDCLKQQLEAVQEENANLKNRIILYELNESSLKAKIDELEKKYSKGNSKIHKSQSTVTAKSSRS